MASSRESSPASEISPNSPHQLTPNSKVKALLAAFDNGSDEESASDSARARLRAILSKKSASTPNKEVQTNGDVQGGEKDTDDDEDDDIVVPKGRMAARMLEHAGSSEEEREQSADDTQGRVREMLSTTRVSPNPKSTKESVKDSEDNEVPVSRKRKIRSARHATPISSPRNASASPRLFVSPTFSRSQTPTRSESASAAISHSDTTSDRFQTLVEKKRRERQERDAETVAQKARKMAEWKHHLSMMEEDEGISDDDEVEKRLTQQSRPTRRAGKKAMEDIGRETQRMARAMQLTHKAITKKKMTKEDFFKRFNFRSAAGRKEDHVLSTTSSSPAPYLDGEHSRETPPTSPVAHMYELVKETSMLEAPTAGDQDKDNTDLPSLKVLASSPPTKPKAAEEAQPSPQPQIPNKIYSLKQHRIRIRQPNGDVQTENSDSDLEILSERCDARTQRLNSIFDRVPEKQAKESHSLHVLKMLSHQMSPGGRTLSKNKKPSMTTNELQLSLQQRARQQATREREDRLQALRDKGIIVQTPEERQKEMAEVEDLIANARREDEAIGQRERAAAKKERKANGEEDPLGDSSEDEDWEEGEKGLAEELSGSENEMEGSEEDGNDASGEEDDEEEDALDSDDDEPDNDKPNSMLDNKADEADNDKLETDTLSEEDEEAVMLAIKPTSRRVRKSHVISDDDDDNEDKDNPVAETPLAVKFKSPIKNHTISPMAPTSVLRSATKTFIPGVTVAGAAGLGLTQIFAGTMDDSQIEFDEPTQSSQGQLPPSPQMQPRPDAMAFLKRLPPPELPPFVPTPLEDTQDVIADSQAQPDHDPVSQAVESQDLDPHSQGFQLGFSQSQVHSFDSLIDPMTTQMSQFLDSTQDVGFQYRTPIRGRFVDVPPSTIDTVILAPPAVLGNSEEAPAVKKKGKLRRRAPLVTDFSDEEDVANLDTLEDEFEISADAFDVMRKASKKKTDMLDSFDKKKSDAKNMINEQAEESEDEYAGLGGASDDESGGEEDELVKDMIDDAGGKNVDERELAAFFAERERASDGKAVEKLYSDISKGLLRRKRGADYDLSDSDDGGEARRRMKQKEFAKMRKALLSDERIGKIAENPKRQAFLRAIEDRGSEDEFDFLEDFNEPETTNDSQSQDAADESQQRVPDSQPDVSMGPPKRKHANDNDADARPPPHLRRTKGNGKKPSNLSEIRESLSSLIEDPNSLLAPANVNSDSEDELDIEGVPAVEEPTDKENRIPISLRRTTVAVVDRISLKRASSSSLSANSRLAFSVSSTAASFKVPALLRRATTNSSITSGPTSVNSSISGMSGTERMAGGAGSNGIKRGGSKNSGVHAFARDTARKATIVKTEKRREQKRIKGAEVRRKVVGGLFGSGKFD